MLLRVMFQMITKVLEFRPAICKLLNKERYSLTLFEFQVPDLSYKGRRYKKPVLRFDALGCSVFRIATTSPIRIIETKSCREDFLRDDKWKKYVEYGTQFAFAAPRGIISPKELPLGIGLFEYSAGQLTKIKEWNVREIDAAHRAAVAARIHSRAVALLLQKAKKEFVVL